jgi:DNA-binding NarL/FixJ family response regulator
VRVLIVEDQPVTREILRFRLERIGCEIMGECDNANAGLEKVRKLTPDLVTLDIEMPEIGGVDSIALFRQTHRENPSTEVLVISASAFPKYRQTFLKEGALAYFIKPIDFDKLVVDLRALFPELQPDTPTRGV